MHVHALSSIYSRTKMSSPFLMVALITVCLAGPVVANEIAIKRLDGSTISPSEIDATVRSLMTAAEVTGVGIGLINDGKIVYLKAHGLRDQEKNLALTEDSVMTAASFTKVVFAYIVMQLVDEKILDLDKPVYQYLPKPLPGYFDYHDLANDSRYERITPRMLLSHTSGFANWRVFEDDSKLKIHFEPGSRYAYSGEGFVLLQLVVETITKRRLEELFQQRVFRPLGMARTSMVWQPRFASDHANGYDEYGRSLGPARRKKADAAGSMLTTLRDFTRFVQTVVMGRGLARKAREQMLSPQIQVVSKRQFPTLVPGITDENKAIRLSYGLGWGLYWTPYGKAFFKEGHDEGWRNYTVCFDQPKTGIVIMTNSSNGEGIYKDLLQNLLMDTFNPIEWEGFTPYNRLPPRAPLTSRKVVRVNSFLLDKYAGRYGEKNLALVVRREGDHLSVLENGGPAKEIFAKSQKEFFATSDDDLFTFVFDSESHRIKLILHRGEKHLPLRRIN